MNVPANRLPDMDSISTSDLRPQLAAILKKVRGGSPVAVTKLNLPVAVVVSPEYFELAERAISDAQGKR